MQTILQFEQSKEIIEQRTKKGVKLSIVKQKLIKSFQNGENKENLKITSYTVTVNGLVIYELPGDHIPFEFLKSGWKNNEVDLLLSQFAKHIASGSRVKMTFQLDEHARFYTKTGDVQKHLLVKYNLARKLYRYVRLGQ